MNPASVRKIKSVSESDTLLNQAIKGYEIILSIPFKYSFIQFF